MTAEGRLARGKENYEAGKFLDNSETIAYAATLESNDVDYSSMSKKELIVEAAIVAELSGNETKDDLIVLLENKSDEAK